MKDSDKAKTLSDIQFDQFFRELETENGPKRLGEEAYKEAKAAEERKSIHAGCPPRNK